MQNGNNNWSHTNFNHINLDDMSDEELKELLDKLNLLTPSDIEELNLLSKQFIGTTIYLIASILQVQVTNIAAENILNKSSKESRPNPDMLAIKFQILFVIARVMFVIIELSRINNLTKELNFGEIDYSLQPNYQVALGNIIALIGDSLELVGFVGIYKRNEEVPFI